MPALDELDVRWRRGPNWQLLARLRYKGGQGDVFTVPAGFVTDYASVPAFMRAIFDDNGPWILAAIIHDYLLWKLAGYERGGPAPEINSRDADGIFRRVMREEGIPFGQRWTMWAAVRVASLFNRERSYGRQFLRDLPAIVAVSVPAVILLGLYAIVTLLTRGLLKLLAF